MKLKRKVRVNVCGPGEEREAVLKTAQGSLRSRILRRLLGDRYDVVILTPLGTSVDMIEIHETGKDE